MTTTLWRRVLPARPPVRHVLSDPRGWLAVCYCSLGRDHEGALAP